MKVWKLLTQREEKKMQKRKLKEEDGSRRHVDLLFFNHFYIMFLLF